MRDELFEPTVRTPVTSGGRPWRLPSQAYVAFFGGVIAGTTIAYLNAGRLGAGTRERRLILATGGVALAAAVTVVALVYQPGQSSGMRFLARLFAVVAYLVQARIQRPFDRAFSLRDGDHGSLWGPGLAAVFGLGLLEVILVAVAVGIVR